MPTEQAKPKPSSGRTVVKANPKIEQNPKSSSGEKKVEIGAFVTKENPSIKDLLDHQKYIRGKK